MTGTSISLDLDSIVSEFTGTLQDAESKVESREVRRLGNVLVAASREMVEEYAEAFQRLGLDAQQLSETVYESGAEIVSALRIDWYALDQQAETLRVLIAFTEEVKTKDMVEARMRGLAVLGRYKRIQSRRENDSSGYDLPFPVKVSKGRNSVSTGGKAGVTYWHNLRQLWKRLYGPLSDHDSEQWLEAKRILADEDTSEVQVGPWTFTRLVS